jgi:hypothetical protein
VADRSGWAYGFWREGSEWLTIAGSARQRPALYPSREAAEAALAATALPSWKPGAGEQPVTARVTERWHGGVSGTGMAYWIDAALNPHLALPPQGQADQAGHPTSHTREQARVRVDAAGTEGVLHAHDPNRHGRCSVLLDGADTLSSYGYPELTVLASARTSDAGQEEDTRDL